MEKNVNNDLRQASTYYQQGGVQGGSETSNVVRVGDSGTDEKTGGGDGGGRIEDVPIFMTLGRVTRMDKIRNEYIRRTAQVGRFGEKTREARLRWYGVYGHL